jgi:radical SAM superfamily enzyme YgiQ (UPF0313 family)
MSEPRETFHLIMIRATHYHNDGYPIRWAFAPIPSNSLASVYGLARDCDERNVLGDNVDIQMHAIDETNTTVHHKKLIRMVQQDGGKALIALIGVQSNQFPRAVDLAQPFLAAGLPVCIGGFHVSGCHSMLDELPEEIVQAQAQGISIFTGEAEDQRLDEVLRDAYHGKLQAFYDHTKDLPELPGQPHPILPRDKVNKTFGEYTSFDLGRGCPFECSFCTIINVQGRKSRFRTAEDLEKIIRENDAQGINKFFITDDNLARNKNWKELFKTMRRLRKKEGIKVKLNIQVDTLCHKIPGFIRAACKAGTTTVFIGLENINPENLAAAKKRQNKITEYREMLLAWREYGVSIICGYIIGFPNDTKESILRDIEIIKQELPIDQLYFTNLTPLPGSEDHRRMLDAGTWMDPDLNKYDLNHRVTHHERMSDAEWDEAFQEAWERFYTLEHMETILRRRFAYGKNKKKTVLKRLVWWKFFPTRFGIHPLEGGYLPLKSRKDRRPGLPRENPLVFYPKYLAELAVFHFHLIRLERQLSRIVRRIESDPKRSEYTDIALTPPDKSDYDNLDLFQVTTGGMEAVEKQRKQDSHRKAVAVVAD